MKTNVEVKNNWPVLILVVAGSAVAAYFWMRFMNAPFVPREFFEARGRGGVLSEKIVSLSRESINSLAEIRKQQEDKNYAGGLDLVLQEIARNNTARANALDLSNQLGVMAATVGRIKPEAASNLALQAIISESQIVQRLINYNNHIYQLLDIFRTRFSNKAVNDAQINELIIKMNEEIATINDFNEHYKSLMTEFDKLTLPK